MFFHGNLFLWVEILSKEWRNGQQFSCLLFFVNKNKIASAVIIFFLAWLTCAFLFWFYKGWTLYEILRYAPEHNWIAYEQALKANPVLSKMAISGIVYSVGDWIAQVSMCLKEIILNEFSHSVLVFVDPWVFSHWNCSVMKESRFLSLIGHACLDQA